MGKNQKKKGKGAEKTASKTEKKVVQKMKKQLQLKGEDDIESIVAEIEKEEQKKLQVVEKVITPPTRRAYASLCAHPYKDELILFGGEYHNGHQTWVYNDLFFYKISTDEWTLVKCPNAPPPRTSHQTVAIPANKGEIWIFGGEFTTKSESQFYHYRDLWQFQLDSRKWTKITSPGGPTARSGHRMVLCKRQLIVFGGYYDNLNDNKYLNDIYAFNLDDYKWTKLEPTGTPPSPRSGCLMAVTPENKIVIWGGYSKTKAKKDVDVGVVHSDMFLLAPEKGDTTGLKWKWSSVKPGGMRYSPRSGMSSAFIAGKAYLFGGSTDKETEEELISEFHNDLYYLDLQKLMFTKVALSGKKDATKSKRRRKPKDNNDADDCSDDDDMEVDNGENKPVEETVIEDGAFTMRIGPALTKSESTNMDSSDSIPDHPHPRINPSLAVKGSKLFMYSGKFEDKDDREYTLGDFYSIDIHKMDEWKTLIPNDLASQEWIESESSDDGSDSECSEEDSEEENDMDES